MFLFSYTHLLTCMCRLQVCVNKMAAQREIVRVYCSRSIIYSRVRININRCRVQVTRTQRRKNTIYFQKKKSKNQYTVHLYTYFFKIIKQNLRLIKIVFTSQCLLQAIMKCVLKSNLLKYFLPRDRLSRAKEISFEHNLTKLLQPARRAAGRVFDLLEINDYVSKIQKQI